LLESLAFLPCIATISGHFPGEIRHGYMYVVEGFYINHGEAYIEQTGRHCTVRNPLTVYFEVSNTRACTLSSSQSLFFAHDITVVTSLKLESRTCTAYSILATGLLNWGVLSVEKQVTMIKIVVQGYLFFYVRSGLD
jgi:hypothetical protein